MRSANLSQILLLIMVITKYGITLPYAIIWENILHPSESC